MGREIRRVPKGWQHPVDGKGQYIPMYDQDYESAASQWLGDCRSWEDGSHEALKRNPELKQEYPYWWDWDDMPPVREQYRSAWTDVPCYQIYETVSKGTPVSPVFDSLPEMIKWLVSQGYSRKAAVNFAKEQWAPSLAMVDGQILMDIETCALPKMPAGAEA